jgi:alpha-galactosidase
MDAMVDTSRTVDGVPTSLCDLGYCDVGLDDNWQACGSYGDAGNYNFHDETGAPLINYDRFPDMKAMTDYAHGLGLTAGWYGNNCICAESATNEDKFFEGDVNAFVDFNFDGWKLDGCGAQLDLQKFDDILTAAGATAVVENCHWGSAVPYEPTLDWCPWNFYRTSGDVRANYASVMGNLATTYK